MAEQYDLVVIGSGPAGHSAALEARRNGLTVAIVEKDVEMIGGVCLNEGCIPAKSLFYNANLYSCLMKNTDLFGIENSLRINIDVLVDKSLRAKEQLKKGLKFLLQKNNVDLVNGEAKVKSGSKVSVREPNGNERILSAGNILISSGSRPKPLPAVSFDGKVVINSSHAVRVENIPESILIIGAGAIGVEFASFFNTLGSRVTLAETQGSLLPFEDIEITKRLGSIFRKKGIRTITGATIENIRISEGLVKSTIVSGDKDQMYEFDKVLIAVGRIPNTLDIGLDAAGVKTDQMGFIEVDEDLMTSVPGIYSAGDVIRTPMLAHTAIAEGEFVASVVSKKDTQRIDYGNIPNAVYSEIEVASVGLTEQACEEQKMDHVAVKQFFLSNGRAVASEESEGFVKVIVSKEDRSIIGAHIIGYKATELIHEFVLARKYGLTCDDIAHAVHAHPTFSETVMEACRAV